jgi:hypothetical protein
MKKMTHCLQHKDGYWVYVKYDSYTDCFYDVEGYELRNDCWIDMKTIEEYEWK